MQDRRPDPDELLIRQVARGDGAAMTRLVQAKLPRMSALARRMLGEEAAAEDVTQELFLRVWQGASRWKPGPARFDTWLHRVALNLCYDRLRKRREAPMAEPPERADEDAPAPDQGLMAADIGRRVQAALDALPERQREAVVLCHYQELSNIEAAQVLGLSVDALESLLARGRRGLRAQLTDLAE